MKITLKQLRDISNYFVYQSYSSDVITDDVEVEISIIEENLNNNILQSVFLLQLMELIPIMKTLQYFDHSKFILHKTSDHQ